MSNLKQRIYEVAMNALLKCYQVPYSVIDTIAISLPEIQETESFVQSSQGDYLLSTDGYVLTTKNS